MRVAREAASARGSADRTAVGSKAARDDDGNPFSGFRRFGSGRRALEGSRASSASSSSSASATREESRERWRAEVYAFNRLMCASELAATRAFMRGESGLGAAGEKVRAGRAGGWSDAESDVEDASEPLPRHLRV